MLEKCRVRLAAIERLEGAVATSSSGRGCCLPWGLLFPSQTPNTVLGPAVFPWHLLLLLPCCMCGEWGAGCPTYPQPLPVSKLGSGG